MPEYQNITKSSIYLPGPNGVAIIFKVGQKKRLDESFDKYVKKGYIKRVDSTVVNIPPPPPPAQFSPKGRPQKTVINKAKHNLVYKPGQIVSRPKTQRGNTVVGRSTNIEASNIIRSDKQLNSGYPISNNIGVGILSYNRPESLRRLVDSIISYTDLQKTTVFISDDCSDNQELLSYLDQLELNSNFVIIRSSERGGVAKNSNRLLKCLERFKYKLLLNDDVEIMKPGWEYLYPGHIFGKHHFIKQEPGLYGAPHGVVETDNLLRIEEKPTGAVLYLDSEAFKAVGYFNEEFGIYGTEHVDYSQRIIKSGLQTGIFDLSESGDFFKVHNDKSALANRGEHLQKSKSVSSKNIYYSTSVSVPEITYVLPCRNFERTKQIETVIDNIKAQKYPRINIIISENDNTSKIPPQLIDESCKLVFNKNTGPFNKANSVNNGIKAVTTRSFLIHDSDTLATGLYTKQIVKTLETYESCHIGKTICYTTEEYSKSVMINGTVSDDIATERVVGYFEGGSIGCTVQAYWAIGGFNEDFKGYGNEDCDFYYRLKNGTKHFCDRTVNFIHLWHSRAPGWKDEHTVNSILEDKLKKQTLHTRISNQVAQSKKLGYIQ